MRSSGRRSADKARVKSHFCALILRKSTQKDSVLADLHLSGVLRDAGYGVDRDTEFLWCEFLVKLRLAARKARDNGVAT